VKAQAADNGQGQDLTPPATALSDVPLDQICMNGDTQARVAINDHIVAEYAEAMAEWATFPPVVLFRDAEGYWVGDGHHRCRAARQVGFTTVQAEVRAGGWREAFLYACSANATHGLRRDALDKRYIVETLLKDEEWGQWSDREIARRCAVSHPFVAKMRADMAARRAARDEQLTGHVTSERTYTTKHGTVATMDTSRIGHRPAPAIDPDDDDDDPRITRLSDLLREEPAGAATPAPTNGTSARRHAPRRRKYPAPTLSAEQWDDRRWYYFVAGLQQVITDFAHGGGLKSFLTRWPVERQAEAKGKLRQLIGHLESLEAQWPAGEGEV
jgi:hypothetical protein